MSQIEGQHESVDVQIGLNRLVTAKIPDLDTAPTATQFPTTTGSSYSLNPGVNPTSISIDEGEPRFSPLIEQVLQLKAEATLSLGDGQYDFSRPNRSQQQSQQRPWWIINPELRFYQTWASLLLLLLLYTAVVQPLRIAFAPSDQIFIPDLIIDLLFTLDIGLSFITAYGNERGRLERRPGPIARRYLATYFLVDLISIFPFFLMPNMPTMITSLRLPRFLKLLKLFRILKMLKLYRLQSLLITLEFSPYVHQKLIRIGQLATIVLAFAHFLACGWYFVGVIGRDLHIGPGTSWLVRVNSGTTDSYPIWYRYVLSLYWSLATLTTVGYGDVNAQTSIELVFAILTMIVGSTLFAYTTATVASMIRERDHQAQRLRDKMTVLRQFASKHHLSARLRSTLMKRMRRIWCAHVTNDESQMAELMSELPTDLALRVTADLHRDLLQRSDFATQYHDQPTFVLSLFRQLLPLKLAEGEMLAHQGDPVRNWYIIESGEIRAVHSKYPSIVTYAVYGFGQTLGDVGLCTMGKWPASMRCATNCRLWMINGAMFLKMIDYFGLRDRVVKHSNERESELKRSMTVADKNIATLEASMTASDMTRTIPAALAAVSKPSTLKTFIVNSPKCNIKDDLADQLGCQIGQMGESLQLMQSQLQELQAGLKKLTHQRR